MAGYTPESSNFCEFPTNSSDICQSTAVSYVRVKFFSPSWKHTSQVMELQYHETRSKQKNRQDMRSECAVVNISEHSQVPSFPEPVASFGHALAPTMYFA